MSAEVSLAPSTCVSFTIAQIHSEDRGKLTCCRFVFKTKEVAEVIFQLVLPIYIGIAPANIHWKRDCAVMFICDQAPMISRVISDLTQMKIEGDLLEAVKGTRSIAYNFSDDCVILRLSSGKELRYQKQHLVSRKNLQVGDQFTFAQKKFVPPKGFNLNDMAEVIQIFPGSWDRINSEITSSF